MTTCRPLAYIGMILMMWGFIWGIFLPDFLWMCVTGMVMGWFFSKDM